jgi:hypothetical protein
VSNTKRKLLVEGEADTSFFSACCHETGINDVWIGPPKSFHGVGSGKGNAINVFPLLIDQMVQGQISHLGIVVDADYAKLDGLGHDETLKKLTAVLRERGYDSLQNRAKHQGYVFQHNDGLPNVGVWIMPDNFGSGFLEDFIRTTIVAAESKLFKKAADTVAGLNEPKFKPHHASKAHVATWLAWQSIPGQGLHSVVGNRLVNLKKGPGADFVSWLRQVYG